MNIYELAREAGFTELEFFGNKVGTNVTECLERFAALVLEEAAEVCDEKAGQVFPATTRGLGFSFSQQWDAARSEDRQCAAAIRALKGAKE